MYGLLLKSLLTLLFLIDIGSAGLVQRRARKNSLIPLGVNDQDSTIASSLPRIDQIPVTIIHEPEREVIFYAPATAATPESEVTKISLDSSSPQQPTTAGLLVTEVQKAEQDNTNDFVSEPLEPQSYVDDESLNAKNKLTNAQTHELEESSPQLQQLSEEPSTEFITDTAAPLGGTNSLKAIVASDNAIGEQQSAETIANTGLVASENSENLQNDLQRQATQATPTQSSTPQNFVQQLIQNSPIGQFLSQFTGGQQQQGQVQADEPATPAPTLPGFLNPAAAITSAQQVVQTAAQSVVNTTTQAFQGLQQFATNLGTQFQNTFSTLAGQQNQLSTADSTTTRPPGPIQSIVSNFVNPGNNQGAESTTGAPGQQQQQGPLQGILNFFQGGNRPQSQTPNSGATTADPPKDESVKPSEVNDKIETDEVELDEVNEVRNSGENTHDETSFEESQGEDLIEVNDDNVQRNIAF